MKYIKLLLECLGLFIISIPLAYIYLLLTGEMQLNNFKEDWVLIIIFNFLSATVVFIIGVIRIKKKMNNANIKNDK